MAEWVFDRIKYKKVSRRSVEGLTLSDGQVIPSGIAGGPTGLSSLSGSGSVPTVGSSASSTSSPALRHGRPLASGMSVNLTKTQFLKVLKAAFEA